MDEVLTCPRPLFRVARIQLGLGYRRRLSQALIFFFRPSPFPQICQSNKLLQSARLAPLLPLPAFLPAETLRLRVRGCYRILEAQPDACLSFHISVRGSFLAPGQPRRDRVSPFLRSWAATLPAGCIPAPSPASRAVGWIASGQVSRVPCLSAVCSLHRGERRSDGSTSTHARRPALPRPKTGRQGVT